ncbi:hypothetical protein [Parafrankia sp. FMc2]|uniref:hypothetical protein n=1 Tax=Parafrankia sp. FMc2 TaxID=3233196 RepID=UPI0034D79E46
MPRRTPRWEQANGRGHRRGVLLWRVKASLRLPPLRALSDGSYRTVLVNPKITGKARDALVAAARADEALDPAKARYARLVEYDVPDRDGDGKHEIIALLTTILDPREATATTLAGAYRHRWEHEIGNKQLKTYLRGPGKVLCSEASRHRLPGDLGLPTRQGLGKVVG